MLTAVINQIRAFLLEYGLPVRKGPAALRGELPTIIEDAENGLEGAMRQVIARLREHWLYLESQIEHCRLELEAVAQRSNECHRLTSIPGIGVLTASAIIASVSNECHRLTSIPGIGVLTASAIIASVGNASAFRKGRELAAWLGLVPRQRTTGGRPTLLGISKRGNPYLRRLLIHGARSLVQHLRRDRHDIGMWITQLERRAYKNVVIVAVANKMARIAWAVLAKHETYRPVVLAA